MRRQEQADLALSTEIVEAGGGGWITVNTLPHVVARYIADYHNPLLD